MSKDKSQKFNKYYLITSTSSLLLIAILLIPITRKAFYWNRCFNQTVSWINEKEVNLKGWEKGAIQSIAVAVCNGAVYEPKF